MTAPEFDDLHEYYRRGEEADRLTEVPGTLEFSRSQEIILRFLPPAPAVVADIGGGPGTYAVWLAGSGYSVEHRDLVPMHVEQLNARAAAAIHAAVGDARELDLADASVDAVLLLGPLYHLVDRADRVRALVEARRIVKPGGPVFAAAISRWAPRLDGALTAELSLEYPAMQDLLIEVEASGVLPPLHDGAFCGYTHRPAELRDEVIDSGLELVDLVGVEGAGFALHDLGERLADPVRREIVLDAARVVERVPELIGVSPHLLATARRRSQPETG